MYVCAHLCINTPTKTYVAHTCMVTALHHFAHVHVGMGEGMRTYVAHLVMASLTYPHVYMYVCMCVCVFAYVSTQASSIKDRSFS